MQKIMPAQVVIDSRMLYFGWVPADYKAVEAFLPKGLRPQPNRSCFANQYVVDRPEQTCHFGVYSLTYMGVDLAGLDVPGGPPARWWTHYMNSSPQIAEYAKRVAGVPSSEGTTTVELNGDKLVATTYQNGKPIIRTTATAGPPSNNYVRGHLRYITSLNGTLTSGLYPAIGQCADPFKITKLEFLDPSSSVYALRPKDPLEIVWGFYFHKAAFAYPGGQEPLTLEERAAAHYGIFLHQ